MNVAIIENNVVINVAVFEDIETAQEFLRDGVFEDADTVQELPAGFGIGDIFKDGEWAHGEREPIEPPPMPPPPTPELTPEITSKINLMWAMMSPQIAESLSPDDIIRNQYAFPLWGVT